MGFALQPLFGGASPVISIGSSEISRPFHSRQLVGKELDMGRSNCGNNASRVCSFNMKRGKGKSNGAGLNVMSCLEGTECVPDSINTCDAPRSPSNCFGIDVQGVFSRESSLCCENVCGDGKLVDASCNSVDSKFKQECTCHFSGIENHFGVCNDEQHTSFVTRQVMQNDSVVGQTKCRWDPSHTYKQPQDDLFCQSDNCRDWALCQKSQLCNPREYAKVLNKGYASVHKMVLLATIVICLGAIPVFIASIVDLRRKSSISKTTIGIGCCSATLLAGCGGTILNFLPLILGSFMGEACKNMRTAAGQFAASCTEKMLRSCGETLERDVNQLCGVGAVVFFTSLCQILAQLLALGSGMALIVSCRQQRQLQKKHKSEFNTVGRI